VNRTIQNVDALSTLNTQITSGVIWCEYIKLFCDVINNGSNEGNQFNVLSNITQPSSFIIIPIVSSPG